MCSFENVQGEEILLKTISIMDGKKNMYFGARLRRLTSVKGNSEAIARNYDERSVSYQVTGKGLVKSLHLSWLPSSKATELTV